METSRRERIVVLLLRLGGLLTLSAFGTVFLPVAWMEATHRWVGLGEFPAAPLVDYLTRSIAVLYGVHGGVMLVVATDLRRYRPLATYLGAMNVLVGALLLGIDLHAGMPWYWTAVEGPPVSALGLCLLVLLRGVPSERGAEA